MFSFTLVVFVYAHHQKYIIYKAGGCGGCSHGPPVFLQGCADAVILSLFFWLTRICHLTVQPRHLIVGLSFFMCITMTRNTFSGEPCKNVVHSNTLLTKFLLPFYILRYRLGDDLSVKVDSFENETIHPKPRNSQVWNVIRTSVNSVISSQRSVKKHHFLR